MNSAEPKPPLFSSTLKISEVESLFGHGCHGDYFDEEQTTTFQLFALVIPYV